MYVSETKLKFPLGYYTINDKVFVNKRKAIAFADSLNLAPKDIIWHFNDDILSSLKWEEEPTVSISELYKQRAMQIREKYDYVIAMFSGGADSTNLVNSFLANNIFLDEIVCSEPISALSNFKFNPNDVSVHNMISEAKYAQLPYLDFVRLNFPKVKITENDYFTEALSNYKKFEYLLDDFYIMSSVCSLMSSLNQLNHVKDLAEKGLKIAVIYGVDKPMLWMARGNIYTSPVDLPLGIIQSAPLKPKIDSEIPYPNVESLAFYWTPDLPELMVKQAHVAARFLFLPENKPIQDCMTREHMDPIWRSSEKRLTIYQRGIVPAIYPDLDRKNVFQADKMLSNETFIEHDSLWLHTNHKDITEVKNLINLVFDKIKATPKNFTWSDKPYTVVPHRKFYKIGTINQFEHYAKQF